jgi:predicted enzyme related to lactoylglutathione lyase
LRCARRLFDDSVAEMFGASATLYLLQKAAGSQATTAGADVRRYRRHWTPVHLDFRVDDIDAAVARARTAGAVVETEATSYPWGRMAVLSDPFGNGFCFLEYQGDHFAP